MHEEREIRRTDRETQTTRIQMSSERWKVARVVKSR